MQIDSGERQVAPMRAGIRRDHVARYEWAAEQLKTFGRLGAPVLDLGCGVGYGTQLLAEYGWSVVGKDNDPEALTYARLHYEHDRASYFEADAGAPDHLGIYGAAVCFEMIEHLADPLPALKSLRLATPYLLASVPNEDEFPWQPDFAFHYRHYTKAQFEALLNAAGWEVTDWWGQEGMHSPVQPGCSGRTIIAVCKRADTAVATSETTVLPPAAAAELVVYPAQECAIQVATARVPKPVPAHVSILALGPSLEQYVQVTRYAGGRHAYCDETWAVNALGDVLACDRIFHMDDVRIQQIRVDAKPDSNIAAMLAWLKMHPGPVYTSRAHPDYPGLVEYPLEEVINAFGYTYFNSTVAYAVAYAIYIGVKKISLFGLDFTYAHSHHAERGRACVEFWLGMAVARGMKLSIGSRSSLMDGCGPWADRTYGYDTVDVHVERPKGDGPIKVSFTERNKLPMAQEIEERYDHTRHVSPLIEERKETP